MSSRGAEDNVNTETLRVTVHAKVLNGLHVEPDGRDPWQQAEVCGSFETH